jgi:hypothetical protein
MGVSMKMCRDGFATILETAGRTRIKGVKIGAGLTFAAAGLPVPSLRHEAL